MMLKRENLCQKKLKSAQCATGLKATTHPNHKCINLICILGYVNFQNCSCFVTMNLYFYQQVLKL